MNLFFKMFCLWLVKLNILCFRLRSPLRNCMYIVYNLWRFDLMIYFFNFLTINIIWFFWTSRHTWIFFEKSWRLFWNISFIFCLNNFRRWTRFFFKFFWLDFRANLMFWWNFWAHILPWWSWNFTWLFRNIFLLVQTYFTRLFAFIRCVNHASFFLSSIRLRVPVFYRWFNL